MAMIIHACGHKGHVKLSGPAIIKSQQMRAAVMRDCDKCREEEQAERGGFRPYNPVWYEDEDGYMVYGERP